MNLMELFKVTHLRLGDLELSRPSVPSPVEHVPMPAAPINDDDFAREMRDLGL